MKTNLHYFTLVRDRDFAGGYFLSPVLDSTEAGTKWHRLSMKVFPEGNTRFGVKVFASDTLDLPSDEKDVQSVESLIRDPELAFDEKLKRLEWFKKLERSGRTELLLHGISGRYLWIAVSVFPGAPGERETGISELQIYFPRQSFLKYLPEIYEASDQNGFLDRFLAVFQSFYEDMNRSIRAFPLLLDADLAPPETLPWLAEWIGMRSGYLWPEDKLRKLLKQGVSLYRRRGTRGGILDFLSLYTGGEVFLVEYHCLEPFMQNLKMRRLLTRLYGSDPFVLTIIVRKELAPSKKAYMALLRVLDEVRPAGMEVKLIVLESYLFLGGHSYLGLNSTLLEYRPLVLDGNSMAPFALVGKKL